MTGFTNSTIKLRKGGSQKQSKAPSINMTKVAAIILGGGQGTRLFPLTMTRCKPAIPFGGRYRLIDIPMSNAINSGCLKIFIVTQFLSASLHQHIFNTYRMGSFSPGFIELLPAEQKPQNKSWFQGTADAVRQNLEYFNEASADYFLILSGDQLYNFDFKKMLQFAKSTNADLTIAALRITESEAKRMGVMKIDSTSFITDFVEKPTEQEDLERVRCSKDSKHPFLGSMGIYLFKREALFKLLVNDLREDFGKHLIPSQVALGKAAAYIYQGYWEDIGTIESFYQANLALTKSNPRFHLYDEFNPIYTRCHNLPGPKLSSTCLQNSIICEGSMVEAEEISHSILGMRTHVKKGTIIRDSYVMGNDYYTPPHRADNFPKELEIGENCLIQKAIIDKHVHIGKNVQLINKNKLDHYNSDDIYIRDGIIIVTRGATLPDGYIL